MKRDFQKLDAIVLPAAQHEEPEPRAAPVPKVQVEGKRKNRKINLPSPTQENLNAIKQTFGTTELELIDKILQQCLRAANSNATEREANAAMAALNGIAPQDGLEGLLAAQMYSVHNIAMEHVRRSTLPDQPTEAIDSQINRAAKLMHLFTEQMDALCRYRNRGQQKVTVQHLNVNGPAVVGNIQQYPTRGGGRGHGRK